MENIQEFLEKAIKESQDLIHEDNKWEERYQEYANLILQNIDMIQELRKNFHKWSPLKFYLTIGEVKKLNKTLHVSVRYQGQEIAIMTLSEKNGVCISTKKFDVNNEKDFTCSIKLENAKWNGEDASKFRKYFATNPKRTKNDNEEHRIESMLISEFSKESAKDKKLCNIQPVKIVDFPFSMPTILSSSREIKSGNGHIDILARNAGKIVVIELKDENKPSEPIKKVLQQATSYAVFLVNLLRSKSGEKWCKIFRFNRQMPKQLVIRVCSAMPKTTNYEEGKFELFKLKCGRDILEYHWLYFEEDGKEITDIDTSLS